MGMFMCLLNMTGYLLYFYLKKHLQYKRGSHRLRSAVILIHTFNNCTYSNDVIIRVDLIITIINCYNNNSNNVKYYYYVFIFFSSAADYLCLWWRNFDRRNIK